MPRPARSTVVERKVADDAGTSVVNESHNQENPRPRRRPMDGGFRDRLTVINKDQNFVYRWVLDADASGARIHWMKEAGWDLAPNKHIVGEVDARNPNPGGDASVARVPANKHGEYHYLMRIKKEWYDEDQATKAEKVNEMDRQIHTQRHVNTDSGRETLYNDRNNVTESRLDFNPDG